MRKISRLAITLSIALSSLFSLVLANRVHANDPEVSDKVLLKPESALTSVLALPDETCLDCHDEMAANLQPTVHRLSSTMAKSATIIGCVSCHSGGEVHAEDPTLENIGNPARQHGAKAAESCSGCHTAHTDLDNLGFDAHFDLQLNCANCHKVHGSSPSLLLDEGAEFCVSCHSEARTGFNRRSNHPVQQGSVTCLSCHSMTNRQDHNVAYDLDRTCQSCHPEQGGPFPYEHEANSAYSLEGTGCIECHNPHGSENDRLLKVPAEQICLQCHIEPAGHRTQSHVVTEGIACQTCHSDHHGSYSDRHYLNPDLASLIAGGPDCSQSDCHGSN